MHILNIKKRMKKTILFILGFLLLAGLILIVNTWVNASNDIADLRKHHVSFLENSPYKETLKLSKKERKASGIPPNKYLEREWELTMNPYVGKPEPEKLFALQEQLRLDNTLSKVPGDKSNDWVERGPDNIGGRTRAIMFDPNDSTNKRVFAGGVSGGLWVNDDITDANSAWTEVGIPQNLAISCITYDPNNTMTFYLGTGETYVSGDVNGNGVWKSADGGVNWSRVFGGSTGDTSIISGVFTGSGYDARLTVTSPLGIAGDYFGNRAAFGSSLTPITGSLVLADDSTALPNEACNALTNTAAINGNIAVIYRGNCDFSQKVYNAQNAGAIAVIMINNVADDLFAMGSGTSGELVTIPSMMISMADGQTIIDELGSGVDVSMNGYRNYSGYTAKPGAQHINDIKVRDIGSGNSEVYIAAGSTFYSEASPSVLLGVKDFGLYKSVDAGSNWSKLTLISSTNSNDYQLQPNDIEIAADNTIWISTTRDLFVDGGGEILSSTDGVNFTLKHKIPYGKRTQIAVSGADASKLYLLSELSSQDTPVSIIYTDDAFTTSTNLPLPVDAFSGIPATDFTNGQAFYNLLLEVDPLNDASVYVGGINLFRSADSGNTWSQISEYYGANTSLSDVHPDQHAFVFDPSDPTKAVNGNDGGVYYATLLSSTIPNISARNNNYNTLQFYNGAIGQETNNEKFIAGSQDNGSQFINNATSGLNGSTDISSGDGTYVFIDEDNEYIISSTQNGNYYYHNYSTGSYQYTIESGSAGAEFINPAALDSNTNYLFSAADSGLNRYKINTTSANKDVIDDNDLTGSVTALNVSSFSSGTLFVGADNGQLFKITNSTNASIQTWTEITGDDFIGSISCIEIGETESDIYVSFHNYGVTNVFYSDDGGTTWQNKEGDLPDLPVKAIMVNPLNDSEVILGTELGVWASPNFNDASPNWYQSQDGMKDVKVTSFDLRLADNTVLATTYGRGMFTGQFEASSSTLSIDDKVLSDYITIYPTVSKGDFKISANSAINSGGLNIFDINGREVYASKISFTGGTKDISLNVSSGLYIVKFVSEGIQSTHKIIIE